MSEDVELIRAGVIRQDSVEVLDVFNDPLAEGVVIKAEDSPLVRSPETVRHLWKKVQAVERSACTARSSVDHQQGAFSLEGRPIGKRRRRIGEKLANAATMKTLRSPRLIFPKLHSC